MKVPTVDELYDKNRNDGKCELCGKQHDTEKFASTPLRAGFRVAFKKDDGKLERNRGKYVAAQLNAEELELLPAGESCICKSRKQCRVRRGAE